MCVHLQNGYCAGIYLKEKRFVSADMKRWSGYVIRLKESQILNKYIVAPIEVKYVGSVQYSYIAITT